MIVLIFILFILAVNSLRTTTIRRPNNILRLSAKSSHKVTIQHNGGETDLNVREDVSILEAAIDAGIEFPYDCKLGVCLTCPCKIVSGEVDHTGSTLDDTVIAKGYALACCVFPRSKVVLKSIEEEELLAAQFSDRVIA